MICSVSVCLGWTTFSRILSLVCSWLRCATREILGRFARKKGSSSYCSWCTLSLICWFTLLLWSSSWTRNQFTFSRIILTWARYVFISSTEGWSFCRMPLTPKSEATRTKVSVILVGFPLMLVSSGLLHDFPFLTAYTLDFKLQHQRKR